MWKTFRPRSDEAENLFEREEGEGEAGGGEKGGVVPAQHVAAAGAAFQAETAERAGAIRAACRHQYRYLGMTQARMPRAGRLYQEALSEFVV